MLRPGAHPLGRRSIDRSVPPPSSAPRHCHTLVITQVRGFLNRRCSPVAYALAQISRHPINNDAFRTFGFVRSQPLPTEAIPVLVVHRVEAAEQEWHTRERWFTQGKVDFCSIMRLEACPPGDMMLRTLIREEPPSGERPPFEAEDAAEAKDRQKHPHGTSTQCGPNMPRLLSEANGHIRHRSRRRSSAVGKRQITFLRKIRFRFLASQR